MILDKKKILSSLALAGILTAGVLGANVNATTANEYLKPVGVYKRLVEGKTVVPYVLKDKNTPVKVSDIKSEFTDLTLVNGNAVTDENAAIVTGDTFVAGGIEYTVVVYGDVNKDGKITTKDALEIQKIAVGNAENIDVLQMEAADVNNNGKVTTKDALAVQKYVVGNADFVIDVLPPVEDNTAPVISGVPESPIYINLNDKDYVLPEIKATDDYDGNVNVVVSGEINKAVAGEYTITYTATDKVGNSASATMTVIVDGNAPVLSGIKEGDTIYIKLNGEYTLPEVTANDIVDGEVEVTVENGIDTSAEGEYTVTYTATDSMNNVTSATLKAVVDGKAPKADVKYSTTVQTKDGVTVTIISDEMIKAPEGWILSEDGKSMKKLYMENVEDEVLMVSDLAGNETEVHIAISNIDTKVTANIAYDVTTPTNGNVIATISSDEALQEVEGWELAIDKKSMTKVFDKNVITDVVVKDVLGNEAIVNVNIQNIDKVAPIAEVQFDVTTMTNGDVVVTLVANEELQSATGTNTWVIDEENSKKVVTTFTANGEDSVTITDLAGNTSVVPVKVSNIDKTAPTLTVSYDIVYSTNKNVTVTISSDEALKEVEGWELAADKKSMTKVYEANVSEEIKVSDLVGNESVTIITITNIDKNAPEVKGFIEGKNSYKEVTPSFTEGVATLQKDDEKSQSYTSGEKISDDGVYILTVTDAAGNSTVVNFTIDNVTPVFDTLEDVLLKNGDNFNTTVVAKDEVDGDITADCVITFDGQEVESIDTTGAKDGEYTLTYTVTDEAGNTATATRKVTVDATAAQVVSLQSSNPDAATEVTIRVEFNEKMNLQDGWVAEDDTQVAFTKKYTANTSETVEFKDVAGNTTQVNIVINNIDSDAPSAAVSYSTTEPTKENVTATISAGEELQEVEGWTLSADKMSMTKVYTANTVAEGEKVVITDLAGNTAEVTVIVTNIDKEAPTGTVSYSEEKNTKNDVTATITSEEELKPVAGWTLSADKKSMSKTYTANTETAETVTISDLAGNTADVTVEVANIDREAPEVTGLTEGVSSYKTLNLTFTDDTAPITVILQKGTEDAITEELTSGDTKTIDTEGSYKLIVKDALGNETTILFDIDKVAVTISGVENGGRYQTATPVFAEGVAVLNTLDTDNSTILSTENYVSGTAITVDGNYELLVTDAAGNTESVKFVVDTKAPEITNIENNKTYTTTITPIVEEKGTIEGIKLIKDGKEMTEYTTIDEITEDGVYELTLTDDLGNSITIKFTIDATGPAITGVENEGNYKVATPVFTEGTATLQKEGEDAKSFVSGTEISADGKYTLVVTDENGNSTTVSFTIDNAGPVVTGVDKTTYIDGETVIPASADTDIESVVLKKDGKVVEAYTALAEITTGDGVYELTVTDKAGNSTIKNFTIDTVVTGASVVASNKGNATNKDVIVTITAREELQEIAGWTLSEDKMSMTKVYSDNTAVEGEDVTISDAAGNTETVKVIVSGIDKDAPTAGVPSYSKTEATNETVTVTIVANEAIREIEGWTLAEDKVTLTKVFEDNGTETVTLVDLAGNTIATPVEVSVDNIYKTAPVISGMYPEEEQTRKVTSSEKIQLPVVTAKDAKNADVTVNVDIKKQVGNTTSVVTGTELSLSEAGVYTITYTATDVAGNEIVIVRIIHVVE